VALHGRLQALKFSVAKRPERQNRSGAQRARDEDGDDTGFGSSVTFARASDLARWDVPAQSDPERHDSPRLFRHSKELYLISLERGGWGVSPHVIARRDRAAPFRRLRARFRALDPCIHRVNHEGLGACPGVGEYPFVTGVTLRKVESMKDLYDVRHALLAHLGDDGKFSLVNARLILRTGINLSSLRSSQNSTISAVPRVLSALREMGFNLDGDQGQGTAR
jgi:hypothetical protein